MLVVVLGAFYMLKTPTSDMAVEDDTMSAEQQAMMMQQNEMNQLEADAQEDAGADNLDQSFMQLDSELGVQAQ